MSEPESVTFTATPDNVDQIRQQLADLPDLPEGMVYGLEITADAEVIRPPHAEECLAAHPGEACPGYPHEEKQ